LRWKENFCLSSCGVIPSDEGITRIRPALDYHLVQALLLVMPSSSGIILHFWGPY
jgi:hypothetical protein